MKHVLYLLTMLVLFCASCQNSSIQKPQEEPSILIYSNDGKHPDISDNLRKNDNEDFSYIVLEDAPYYIDGPQQASPPDGSFKRGTKLKLIRNAGSYSLVESQEGTKAYVAISAIK